MQNTKCKIQNTKYNNSVFVYFLLRNVAKNITIIHI